MMDSSLTCYRYRTGGKVTGLYVFWITCNYATYRHFDATSCHLPKNAFGSGNIDIYLLEKQNKQTGKQNLRCAFAITNKQVKKW
jgi:hypothetical protein